MDSGVKPLQGIASGIKSWLLNYRELFSHSFEVDAVYCYADNKDPERLRQRQSLVAETDFGNPVAQEAIDQQRFNDYGEFRYSLRSLVKFAPWFRNLYVITATPQISWLRAGGNGHKVFIVPDERLFPSNEYLPNFNSGALETLFDELPGLSEHFLYFNDDMFLGDYVTKNDFFTPDGRCRINEMGSIPSPTFMNIPLSLHKQHIINSMDSFQKKYEEEKAHWNAHQAQPLLKSVYRDCKKIFAAECDRTARNKFRGIDDILMTVILFPSYALHHRSGVLSGRGMRPDQRYAAINDDLVENEVKLNRVKEQRPKLFCLNDETSHDNPAVREQIGAFLQGYFPKKSDLEY